MSLFDRFKQGVDTTKFKADQLLQIQRIQGEVGLIQKEVTRIKGKIADTAVQLHVKEGFSHPSLDDLFRFVDQLTAEINEKEAQIQAIRAQEPPQSYIPSYPAEPARACPSCGAPVSFGAAFCSNCGNVMPPLPEPAFMSCPNCGFRIPGEAEFCTNCGQSVSKSP